jgi:DNA/RNA-binding domain of Phe-tRNA-synthetase-like protein
MSDPPASVVMVEVEPHRLLRLTAFVTEFPVPLGDVPSPSAVTSLLRVGAPSPFAPSEDLQWAVRDMLRVGGHKPTGRGKPASEYLARAALEEGGVRSINLAADACNVVSLHSGLPISVVDLDRARGPFRVAVGAPGERYVFNPSGQEIDLKGLLCLFDAEGPCGNAVKDSQRTKTDASTLRTLSLMWGCVGFEERLERATGWYRELLEGAGATTAPCTLSYRSASDHAG